MSNSVLFCLIYQENNTPLPEHIKQNLLKSDALILVAPGKTYSRKLERNHLRAEAKP